MNIQGSCHCGSVTFTVRCPHPYPYNLCYCGICRKTAGSGGYAINLGAEFDSMVVEGEDSLAVYSAQIDGKPSSARRHFCKLCGSALWAWDPRWPELVHPFASAIDSELPVPPQRTHLMLGSKATWVPVHRGKDDLVFDEYPDESIAAWHKRHGFVDIQEN